MQFTHTSSNPPASIAHDVLIMSAYEALQNQCHTILECVDASAYNACSGSSNQALVQEAFSLNCIAARACQACINIHLQGHCQAATTELPVHVHVHVQPILWSCDVRCMQVQLSDCELHAGDS